MQTLARKLTFNAHTFMMINSIRPHVEKVTDGWIVGQMCHKVGEYLCVYRIEYNVCLCMVLGVHNDKGCVN